MKSGGSSTGSYEERVLWRSGRERCTDGPQQEASLDEETQHDLATEDRREQAECAEVDGAQDGGGEGPGQAQRAEAWADGPDRGPAARG